MVADVIVGFQPEGKTLKIPAGSTIFQVAKQAGIGIRSECGGKGSCGKCKVIVRNFNAVSETTQTEKKHLSRSEIEADYRLACQTEILRDVTIEVPPESQLESRKIQIWGLERRTALNPSLKKYHLELLEPTLSDATPDLERLLTCLERENTNLHSVAIDYRVLTDLPFTLRRADWNVAVILWDDTKIVDVEPIAKSTDIFGLAVDIGTSKIVGHLVNLTSGDTIAIESVENPQIVHGDDIITRITFASLDDTNLQTLQELLVDSVNKLLRRTCAKAKVNPSRVYHVVGVGNTAMHHFFLGIKPENIAVSPFTPAVKRRVNVDAKDLQIKMAPRGLVTFLPLIAGFVGADAVADLLVTELCESDQLSLLLDMGTNTEVFVGNKDDVLCCSCASGPAFEGAHITHGMRAATGAIEQVSISPDLEVEYETIGGEKPKGICGSAMIDIVAEMLRRGIMDNQGRFNAAIETQRMLNRKKKSQAEFVLAWRDETTTGKEITITQNDIGEIQLAKAAIQTGWSILMKRKRTRAQDLDRVLIAGAFGEYINVENARLIRLIPDLPASRVEFVGNAAVAGAKTALISRDMGEKAANVSNSTRYLELAADPAFNQEFAQAMRFGGPESNKKGARYG